MSATPIHPRPAGRTGPVERFLGPQEAAGGPFALLGLSPQLCTDELILTALDRQLERIAQHPECDTPGADEVRLALHAAAAQLLDPTVRRLMAARWAGAAAAPAPLHAPARRASAALLLEHDAVLTLGLYGGWNRRSLHRLVSLAHARGLSSNQVAHTLRHLAASRRPGRRGPRPDFAALRPRGRAAASPRRPVAPASSAPLAPSANEPLPEQIDPAMRALRSFLIISAVGIVALAIASLVIVAAADFGPAPTPARSEAPGPGAVAPSADPPSTTSVRGPAAPAAPDPADAAAPAAAVPADPAPASSASPARAETPPPAEPEPPVAIAEVPRALAALSPTLDADPDAAAARFERLVRSLAASWPQLQPDQLVASHDAVVEFVYRAIGHPTALARAADAVSAGARAIAAPGPLTPDDVAPAVWSTGMLARLARERDLPSALRSAMDSTLAAALGGGGALLDRTFEGGAKAALVALPAKLLGEVAQPAVSVEAWRRWADAADAFAAADPALRTRLFLGGLEALLVHGPRPDADQATFQSIALLTARLTWNEGDESRRRLLNWLGDRRLDAADLHAITATLARQGAPGVDVTMVLSPAASDRVRADLRERFARVWRLDGDAPDDLIADWARSAREALAEASPGADPIDHLARAVLAACLNEAASWHWRGEPDAAVAALNGADAAASVNPLPTSAAAGALGESGESPWAVRYLAVRRNIPIRVDLLDQLLSRREVDPIAAEVLASEALAGSPAEVRLKAQHVVRQFAGKASVVNAMLEYLPRAPRHVANSRLIEDVGRRALPSIRSPDWPMAARRALVERLLELLASAGPQARIDALSAQLAAAYMARAAQVPPTEDQRLAVEPARAHESAAAEWSRWLREAEANLSGRAGTAQLDRLQRRRAGRLGQASGFVQAFAAEQASLCEVMAYVVATERPDRAELVAALLTRLAGERRRARHIFEQLSATERAMTQLWLIRFGEEWP